MASVVHAVKHDSGINSTHDEQAGDRKKRPFDELFDQGFPFHQQLLYGVRIVRTLYQYMASVSKATSRRLVKASARNTSTWDGLYGQPRNGLTRERIVEAG